MKKILLLVIGALFILRTEAQEINLDIKVDERTELMSIVFRLAGNREYSRTSIKSYSDDIDKHFKQFENHKLIMLARKLHDKRYVSYDAVMSMAINLEIKDGKIKYIKGLTKESLESRWAKKRKFLKLLNKFYKDTEFHTFFNDHKDLYTKAINSFNELKDNLNLKWFEEFYGTRAEGNFHIILSMTNGSGNYGVSIKNKDGREDLYAIICPPNIDSDGKMQYGDGFMFLLVHEFSHSFCNDLIDKHYPEMQDKAEVFFNLNERSMRNMAYANAKTMCYEILVRACECKYAHDNGVPEGRVKMKLEMEKAVGFLWIDTLYTHLNQYADQREKYATLEDYMPELVKLQNSLDPVAINEELKKNLGKISGFNITSGDEDVDPSIKYLVVKFSQEMDTGNHGLSYGDGGRDAFPKIRKDEKTKWNEEATEWIVPIKLKPNKEYILSIPPSFFKTKKKYFLNKKYFLKFKTGDIR